MLRSVAAVRDAGEVSFGGCPMLLLKVLTIVLGLAIAGSRAVCLVSPATSRKMMRGFLERPLFVNTFGLVAALLGVSLWYAARRAIWIIDPPLELNKGVWALLLGAVVCVAGFVVLIRPSLFRGMLGTIMGKSDAFRRVIMGIGLVVGLAILAYAIWVLVPPAAGVLAPLG
jgi:hypothetical protein